MPILEVKNLVKSFGKTEVLKGIDFSIEKGDVLSIIGSSGSGKTTLLRCLNFLEFAENGTIAINDKVIYDGAEKGKMSEQYIREMRLHFGLVFQSFNLFPQYNVIDNITLAPTLLLSTQIENMKKSLKKDAKTDKSLTGKVIKEKLAEFKKAQTEIIKKDGEELLEKVGLTDKRLNYPCELSGGQCQRVAIARALALKPKILCFDEPTSALDPELTGEVLKVIRSLKDEDRTMIIVTHEMGFAKNVSDKIVFMADGVVEEQGIPKDVLDNPKSEKLKHFLSSVSNKDGE